MKKQWSVVFWVIVAAFVFVAAYMVYNRTGGDAQFVNPPLQGEDTGRNDEENTDAGMDTEQTAQKNTVPDFTLTDINGNEVKLSDFKGKKVVLNFWAVWCKYCREEMPDMEKVHKKFEEEGNAVLLAINVQEDMDKVKKYVEDSNLTLRVLMDYDGAVASMFPVEGFPTTFILNSDGTPYGYIPGKTDEKTLLDIISKAK